MELIVPFNIIDNIHKKIGKSISISLTSIIHKEYTTYSPFISDITNAYFRNNYISVIQSNIPDEIVDSINNYMISNEYEKLSFISEEMVTSMIDYLKATDRKNYVNLIHDILFLIYKKYGRIPIYDKNIMFPNIKLL